MSKGRSHRGLSPEEQALWRKVTRTVKSVQPVETDDFQALIEGQNLQATAIPEVRSAKQRQTKKVHSAMTRSPVHRGAERRIKRGKIEIDSRIDLHGMTQSHARNALLGFLIRAWNRGERSVLVITGKGVNPHVLDQRRFEPWDAGARDLPGVLRRALPRWLAEPDFSAIVSGYAPAHVRHGGSGAWYIFLRG